LRTGRFEFTFSEKANIQYRILNGYFFFFSAVLILVTKILSSSHPKTAVFGLAPSALSFQRNTRKSNPARTRLNADSWRLTAANEILTFVFIFHSTFDVGRSMFNVLSFFEQPFFQVICLFLHLFPFNVSRLGVIGCSMFIFSNASWAITT